MLGMRYNDSSTAATRRRQSRRIQEFSVHGYNISNGPDPGNSATEMDPPKVCSLFLRIVQV